MKGIIIKTGLVFGLVIVLLSTNITPGLLGRSSDSLEQKSNDTLFIPATEKTSMFSLNVFGTTNLKKQDVALSADDATLIFDTLKELKSEMTQHPYCEKTQSLKIAFIDLLDEKGLIPDGVSKETYLSLLNPRWAERLQKTRDIAALPQPFANRGTCALCSVGGEGSGILIPLFLLPRPRVAMLWLGTGLTTAANLLTSKGYVAGGAQTGFAFGFMGIGLSYALPGYTLYGFIGYALLTSTTAEYVEHYPPNRAPTISDVLPADGGQNIPLSLSELQFRIQDADGDLMSYTITTDPDIGSASGNLKPFGVYTVPVSGLQDLTKYTWHIQVTDGKDTAEETLTFTTEAIAPIISNPSPADRERDVPMDIPHLQFTLKDYQGDAMEYTVQTSPNIGSDHKVGVHDGTYTIPVSGLTYGGAYRWYINVTDGPHWTRKVFSFETGYPSQFDAFDFGWLYRKQITIDHTQITDDLDNFPVLISTIDADLMKAQEDGGDILFMNGAGVAVKQRHEIETFDVSSGKLVAWVNINDLSSNEDTVFYMYYGNPDCINQEYPEKTWDSHHKAVWHMNDATPSTIEDSTSDGITGLKKAVNMPVECSGKIGKGQQFTRTATVSEYITMNDLNMLRFSGDFTISAWIYPLTTQNMRVAGKHQDISANYKGYALSWDLQGPGTKMSLRVDGGGYNYQYIFANEEEPPSNWYYLTGMKRSGTNYLYIDGVQQSQTGTQTLVNSDYPFCIGAWRTEAASANFNGIIDEVRVSDIGRSPAWIETEYNNMNNPALFFSIGPEVPGP